MVKLSKFHLYSIAVLALIVVVALFWPTGDKPLNNAPQNQPIVIPPPTIPDITPDPIQTPPVQEPEGNEEGIPTEPEIVPEPIETVPTEPPAVTPPTQPQEPQATRPSADEWQNYRVQKGKTLAQLFRDNNLQANDAFIMARVEGAEKPLSNLRQGQKIRLKANGKGEVQLLETTASDGKTYSFARLSDGSYYRTP
ncbi:MULTISPECIES: LysM-like peptidoglycan-binding domain-containing protein [Providencia]|uniref:LysM-like peptidoglycan-binding domain-containing protein n=1 Tax=Providencia TaxID=586 RepID=UPI001C5A832F|nr:MULTISPECIES: LysM-like peptidoglycan-binding domain-containing protein [Providencia]ELR5150171.1 cell envelope opacity-associated protein A [Providencia rettgeri]QXX81695.1 cell envelope opacity-associated protein A [Providencia sp. R33]